MKLTDDSWYVVRNTPGVTGFVGMGNQPTPLEDAEVKAILKQMEPRRPKKVRVNYQVGQAVKITDGPFTDFEGTVEAIDEKNERVRVTGVVLWARHAGGAGLFAGCTAGRLELGPAPYAPARSLYVCCFASGGIRG